MKLLARYLYLAARSLDPNGLGVICAVAFAVLILGMLQVGLWAREVIRCGAARF